MKAAAVASGHVRADAWSSHACVIALDTASLCAALLVPTLLAALVDGRTLNGVNVWTKPLKFEVSFALHWLTVAWLVSTMAHAERTRSATARVLSIGGCAAVVEVLYIVLQAARGRASHFNFATPWETILYYALMGGAALAMMATTAWVGWRAWRAPARRDGLWLGAVVGLLGGSLLTVFVTAPLAAGVFDGPGHWVGGVHSDAAGLPITGWSTSGGDLRVPHFFATHLLQAAPMAGWVADRLWPRRAQAVVWCVLAIELGAVAGTLIQAIAGQPFMALGLLGGAA